jgi:ATP-dependent helicase/nuclease subunit A
LDVLQDLGGEPFAARRARLVESGRRRRTTSATELGRARDPAADEASEPWARGRAATRLGRAVHAGIQSASWTAQKPEVSAIARAQAVAQAIPDRASDIEALIRVVLQSDIARRAVGAKRALREVPFAAVIEGLLVEGFIDLVIEDTSGDLEIVDWKTDAIGPSEVPDRLAGYRLQAGLYVLGLEAATGKRVRSVSYFFVSAGVEASPGDPEGLANEARARLRETGTGALQEENRAAIQS